MLGVYFHIEITSSSHQQTSGSLQEVKRLFAYEILDNFDHAFKEDEVGKVHRSNQLLGNGNEGMKTTSPNWMEEI